MKTCIIFNPAARGDKARHFQKNLHALSSSTLLKPSLAPGNARALAAQAVRENFDLIVAAGGDGTINEVLNGIGDVPDAFAHVRLGVLPIGTVNVLACELGIPLNLAAAWKVLQAGRDRLVDLPQVDFLSPQKTTLFTQIAGFGFDARAIQLMRWPLKKKIGRFAYLVSALQALHETLPEIVISDGERSLRGPFVLVGNGRLYGGRWAICPNADWQDGLLEVTVFPKLGWLRLLRATSSMLIGRLHSLGGVQHFRAPVVELNSASPAPVQVDGEYAGTLPARCSLRPRHLRVVVP